MKNLIKKKSLSIFSLTSFIILFLIGSSQMLFAQAADDDALFIDASGNVGIGTDSPRGTLDIAPSDGEGNIFGVDRIVGFNDLRFFTDNEGNSGGAMYIGQNGNVGIGNTSPLGPLSIGNSAIQGSDGFLVIGKKNESGSGSRHFRIGFDDSFNFRIGDYGGNNGAEGWKSPFSINWQAPSSSFHINGDGNVGIGTNTPGSYKLNVDGSANFSGTVIANGIRTNSADNFTYKGKTINHYGLKWGFETGYYGPSAFLSGYGAIKLFTGGKSRLEIWNNGDVGINGNLKVIGNVQGASWTKTSDQRLKILQSNSKALLDLSTLMNIEVVDYHYKDVAAYGSRARKGVIAQQVEKFLPIAITRSTGIVPDIYQKASFKDGWVMLEADLKQGDKVRIIGEKTEDIYEVLEVNKGKFRTNFIGEEAEVFVYGRQVDDFLSVDYDAISMLNVSATQEIARQMEQLQAGNKEQATRITELEKQIEDMETLKAAVAQLQLKLNGEM